MVWDFAPIIKDEVQQKPSKKTKIKFSSTKARRSSSSNKRENSKDPGCLHHLIKAIHRLFVMNRTLGASQTGN
ncbi:hypothetical protein CEXT_329441 [Caerostris extrusa]|uniref:Uncharacterized protein n=1 Tax=Caerostris extrusa TaxID=172846 RepID=A0AAV4NJJ2_CAEEX|nr:hypothetical protein CEXT_329441 [Caerostris extrusa]